MRNTAKAVLGLAFLIAVASGVPVQGGDPVVDFDLQENQLLITIGNKPFATYVFRDDTITRPYFAHVKSPSGIQVTRNHPPIPGKDYTDHENYHPGLFLAFGDISGHDYWRLKARVHHDQFLEGPSGGPGRGTFTVRNQYLTTDGSGIVCTQDCRYTILTRPNGYLLILDSTFSSDQGDFSFGEQDEMGLGIRVNTGITVERGSGEILNAEGMKNEDAVREKESDWCALRGVVDGTQVGVMVMPSPKNIRRSWWHARDYGFTAGNFFGHDRGTNPTLVKKGEKFPVGYGVHFFSAPETAKIDLDAAYQDYLDFVNAASADAR